MFFRHKNPVKRETASKMEPKVDETEILCKGDRVQVAHSAEL